MKGTETICKQMNVAMFQKNFIFSTWWQARYGSGAIVCLLAPTFAEETYGDLNYVLLENKLVKYQKFYLPHLFNT